MNERESETGMAAEPASRSAAVRWVIALALVCVTALVYAPVRQHEFVRYDDPAYVVDNPVIRQGLSVAGVIQVFRTTVGEFWLPMAQLSHMVDVQLFGLNPAGHHLHSVLLHALNAALLFGLLSMMTGSTWRSAAVAALFALHPLNVESVAWVAERKNVLCAFFWLTATWTYVRYARGRGWGAYLATCLLFMGALMSKPMAVTFPFVLLLLDFWPLGRGSPTSNVQRPTSPWLQLLVEKIPFFLLSIGFSFLAYETQLAGGAVSAGGALPLHARLAYSALNYLRYLDKLILPRDLSVLYPLKLSAPPVLAWGMALVVLALITAAVLQGMRRCPYLLTGWFWFLGVLVPMIGIVMVGHHDIADRFTYVAQIGLFIAVVWGFADLAQPFPALKVAGAVVLAGLIAALAMTTRVQLSHWQNSVSLFEQAVASTRNNYIMHDNLGRELANQGRLDEALTHFSRAVEINPWDIPCRANLALALYQKGSRKEAISLQQETAFWFPGNAQVHCDLGTMLAESGFRKDAIAHLSEAVRLQPDLAAAHYRLGLMLVDEGQVEEGRAEVARAVELNPDSEQARKALAGIDSLGKKRK